MAETEKDDLKYWVALSHNLQIGSRTFKRLYQKFETMREVWERPPRFLAEAVAELKNRIDPEKEWQRTIRAGINILCVRDKNYPLLLKEIPDPPALLYFRGELKEEDGLAVAVVGSRKFSAYGQRIAVQLGRELAENKITVVSGLALGIDSICQRAAIEVGGRTIGILACGLDQIYPAANTQLAKKIITGQGAIVSEFPIGVPALTHHFPIRNRIIAGLSLGTVVVEGAEKSGSLLTAAAALDYNREIFATPGDIDRETAFGPNHLIKMGAKLITGVDDILAELNIEKKSSEQKMKRVAPPTPLEDKILAVLEKRGIVHIDKISEEVKLEIAQVNAKVILMEMKGMVRNLGAGQYEKR